MIYIFLKEEIFNMIKSNTDSNAQNWELEVICKNKKYLDAVVKALLKSNIINFQVELIDVHHHYDGDFDGRYTVFMWSSWFNNLSNMSDKLKRIEKKFDKS